MKQVCAASDIGLFYDNAEDRFLITRGLRTELIVSNPREAVIAWSERAEAALLRRIEAWKK